MKKEFSLNILILLCINIIVRPVYLFFVDAQIQNQIGLEEYGKYFVVYNFSFLFLFLNDPGLQNFATKKISEHSTDKHIFLRNAVGLKLILALVYLTLLIVAGWIYGFNDTLQYILLWVGLSFIFSSLFVFLRGMLAGSGHYKSDSWVSGVDRILMIFTLGGLLICCAEELTIEKMVMIQAGCYFLSCLVVVVLLARSGLSVLPQYKVATLKAMLKQSLPYAIIMLMMTLYMRIDGVMLDMLLVDGEREAGIYAAGYRFLDAGNMLGFMFGSLLLPMYSNLSSRGEKLHPLFDNAWRLLMVVCTGLAVGSILFGEEIYALIYDTEIRQHHEVLSALMLSLLPLGLSHAFGSMLQATSNTKPLNVLILCCVIFNIGTNLIIIPSFGALGAAYTTFATEIIMMVGLIYICHSFLKITINKKTIFQSLSLLVFSITIFYMIKYHTYLSFFMKIALCLIVYVVIVFFTKIIDLKALRKLAN